MSGNLESLQSDAPPMPAGEYLAEVMSARLKSGKSIYADVIFKLADPATGKTALIAEHFDMNGKRAKAKKNSRLALTQIAEDAGIPDMRDLKELTGKQVRLIVELIEGKVKKGRRNYRVIFPRPEGYWKLEDTHLDAADLL